MFTLRARAFKTVDVFTHVPLLGNPVAVVLDADGLTDDQMRQIARWTNLSETTFVLPPTVPGADYRLRIFTPGSELPFAGHPTLGSAYALLEAGRVQPRHGQLMQECGTGLVNVAVTVKEGQTRLALSMPEPIITTLPDAERAELEAILGHAVAATPLPATVNVGAVWLVAALVTPEQVLSLTPDYARSADFERRLGITGVCVFARTGQGEDIEVRTFAPSCGVNEYPVCGSGNGAIGWYRRATGELLDGNVVYQATQGRQVGRDGRLSLTVSAVPEVTVGGYCVTCVDGILTV